MKKTHKEDSPVLISISTGAVIRILAIIVVCVLMYLLRDIVLLLIVSLLLATLIAPLADLSSSYSLPRGIAVVIIYVSAVATVAGVLMLVVPAVYNQTSALVEQYTPVLQDLAGDSTKWQFITQGRFFEQDIASFISTIQESGTVEAFTEVVAIVSSVFGGVIALFIVLILAYYMVVEEYQLIHAVESVTPARYKAFVRACIREGRYKVGRWMRGQLMLMLIVGFLDFAVLSALGVPFALVLAILGGLLEIVPYVGPNLAAIPAILISFSISPALALLVLLGYFIVQQIESDILTPKIMQKVVGINPILSIVAITAGYTLYGVIGAFLSIPLTVMAVVIIKEWMLQKHSV